MTSSASTSVEVKRSPGLTRSPGVRTQIQQRCCHGLVASSCGQSQIVAVGEFQGARPITSRSTTIRTGPPDRGVRNLARRRLTNEGSTNTARPEVGDRRPGDTVSRERRFALAGAWASPPTWLVLSGSSCPGRASEAAALVLAVQEFVANGEERPSGRRPPGAASPRRTSSRDCAGRRGCWAFDHRTRRAVGHAASGFSFCLRKRAS